MREGSECHNLGSMIISFVEVEGIIDNGTGFQFINSGVGKQWE